MKREGVNNEFQVKEGEGRHATDTRRWKYKPHSERDWANTEMSKGWRAKKTGLGRESGLGRKGWGGRRKALKEHPRHMSIRAQVLPQGGRAESCCVP